MLPTVKEPELDERDGVFKKRQKKNTSLKKERNGQTNANQDRKLEKNQQAVIRAHD